VDLTQALFLGLLFLGLGSLLSGVFWTRLNWRQDVRPFGRWTSSLDLVRHPERYANQDAVRAIRTMTVTGRLLLAGAAAMVAYELLRITSSR
jgi:hypothetical protein